MRTNEAFGGFDPVAGLADGERQRVGRFRYVREAPLSDSPPGESAADASRPGEFRSREAGFWEWSATLFAIFGYEPGEVTPTTDLLHRHRHPEDGPQSADVLSRALTGEFGFYHRIVDHHGATRHVVVAGRGSTDEHGVAELHGYVVDLTDSRRDDVAEEVRRAVRRSAATRATIDQAKGVLMFVFGLDADTAFGLLRWHSQQHNVKLRELADVLVSELGEQLRAGEDSRTLLNEWLLRLPEQLG